MEIKLTRPDDWHLHLRDDALMHSVLPDTARQFARAIVMPNLRPPVTSTVQAVQYRQRILAALPAGAKFEPLMTLYLTDNTSAEEIKKAKASGVVHAVKLYPAGATTNSDAGVTDLRKTYAALEEMQRCGMPLLVHGEVTSADIDIFDREAVFIERVLQPLLKDMPNLHVVFEHITTKDAAQFVTECAGHHRRHAHAATPALQPQRHAGRRHPPALLLPAHAQARDAPRSLGEGRHQRQQEILPRHRQRPARATYQRKRLRLRRLLHRT